MFTGFVAIFIFPTVKDGIILLCIKTGKCIIWKCCMMKFLIQCIILSMQEKQWETCQQYQSKEEGVMKKHDRKRAVILSD